MRSSLLFTKSLLSAPANYLPWCCLSSDRETRRTPSNKGAGILP